MHANCIISKVNISSNCVVNSHTVFSESLGICILYPKLSLYYKTHKNKSYNYNNHFTNISSVIFLYKKYICYHTYFEVKDSLV